MILILLFLLSIAGANWAVSELDPVAVWPGIYAPAGVYFIALTLALRDLVQRAEGVRGVIAAGAGGIALSLVLADAQVVSASVAAFAVSFLIDTLVFSVVWYTFRGADLKVLIWAVLISGLVSIVPDTLIFCYMAGFPEFIPGQLIGKAYGTIAYAGIFALDYWWNQRKVQRRSVPSE